MMYLPIVLAGALDGPRPSTGSAALHRGWLTSHRKPGRGSWATDSEADWRGSVGSYPDTAESVPSSCDSLGFQLMGERARERDLGIVLVQGVPKAGNFGLSILMLLLAGCWTGL